MSISNIELREKIFGGRETPPAVQGTQPPVARLQEQFGAGQSKGRPARWLYADAAKGLAAVCLIALAMLPVAPLAAEASGVLVNFRAVIESFALPAFLVMAGLFVRPALDLPWLEFIERKIAPFAIAVAIWLGFMVMAGFAASNLDGALATATAQMKTISLLFLLPAFFIAAKLLRFLRPATVLFLAALAEILHTNTGHFLLVDAMRGAVFFFAGVYLAHHAPAFARFTRANPGLAMLGVAVWLAFAAFIGFGHHMLAHGRDITTLPFTSLGLGAAGAMALLVTGELLAASAAGRALASIGQRWIGWYVAAPLAGYGLAALLAWSGLAMGGGSVASDALLAFGLAIAAGLLALLFGSGLDKAKDSSKPAKPSGFYRQSR